MPLLDHFHPPLAGRRHWESFHSAWATTLVNALVQRWLPSGFYAEERVHRGPSVEIDVATFEDQTANGSRSAEGGVATLPPRLWTPPAPALVLPAVFPDTFEVLVFKEEGGARLVAAIEFVSPSNKDRPAHRRGFAVKCASYLYQGVALVIVDIVTDRHANLHNEIMRLMESDPASFMPAGTHLYAVSYRPVRRDQKEQLDLWPEALALGQPLPLLPLGLGGDLCIPLGLEETYADLCRIRNLAP